MSCACTEGGAEMEGMSRACTEGGAEMDGSMPGGSRGMTWQERPPRRARRERGFHRIPTHSHQRNTCRSLALSRSLCTHVFFHYEPQVHVRPDAAARGRARAAVRARRLAGLGRRLGHGSDGSRSDEGAMVELDGGGFGHVPSTGSVVRRKGDEPWGEAYRPPPHGTAKTARTPKRF